MSKRLALIGACVLVLSGCQSTQALTKVSCDFVSGVYQSNVRQMERGRDNDNVQQQNVANGVISVIFGLFQSSDRNDNNCT